MTEPVPLRLSVRRSNPPAPLRPGVKVHLTVDVPSDVDFIEHAVDIVVRHCCERGVGDHITRFNLPVALSEALANAIRYGNRSDPSKIVKVMVASDERRIEIHVSDQGQGFDPSAVPDPTTPDRIERADGRGLFLIRQLMDDVSFNERGNAICMVLPRA